MPVRSTKTFIFTDTDAGGVIHVANIKGGVGKSTVATNLAASLAKRGPVLLIDLDAQGSATHAFGKDPDDFKESSFELFRKRFSSIPTRKSKRQGFSLKHLLRSMESYVAAGIMGQGDITRIKTKVGDCLDLIPAGSALFNDTHFFHLQNFLFNLEVCRTYYKYVVIDTPSVWNRMTRMLYAHSDLNLIPVTLSALATKSLRDYLVRVRDLADRNPKVRIRIVKNEVFGSSESKIKGKTRTMGENRSFLDKLCEQIVVRNTAGISSIPSTLMFDLEIPESATVRDAQDEGKPLIEYMKYAAVTKAFDELGKRVQYVLNAQVQPGQRQPFIEKIQDVMPAGLTAAAAFCCWILFCASPPALNSVAPRPVAPQQLAISADQIFEHTFNDNETLYRVAKYAVCRYRAMVPSYEEVMKYVRETIDLHNATRLSGETRIPDADHLAPGTTIAFYPPSQIRNPNEAQLKPVYDFFSSMVKDSFVYVTGDWCFRGTGGGTPHYGIDVAATLGSDIITMTDGIVVTKESEEAGHMLGVVNDGTVLFFCHMNKRYFSTGQRVKKGDAVGCVGMTGKTSGPHVHVGYAIRTLSADGVPFGRFNYKFTDPKLFFYRQAYDATLASKG